MGAMRRRGFTLIEMVIVVSVLAVLAGIVVPMLDAEQHNAAGTVRTVSLQNIRDAWIGGASSPGLITDLKYVPGFNYHNCRMRDLLGIGSAPAWDAATRRGWRGPYIHGGLPIQNLRSERQRLFPAPADQRFTGDATFEARGFYGAGGLPLYGTDGDLALGDEWGNPIVLQVPPLDTGDLRIDSNLKCWRYARVVSAGADGILDTALSDPLAERLADNSAPGRGDDIVVFLNRVDVHE